MAAMMIDDVVEAKGHPSAAHTYLPAVLVSLPGENGGGAAGPVCGVHFTCDKSSDVVYVPRAGVRPLAKRRRGTAAEKAVQMAELAARQEVDDDQLSRTVALQLQLQEQALAEYAPKAAGGHDENEKGEEEKGEEEESSEEEEGPVWHPPKYWATKATVVELREELKRQGKPTAGNKATLQEQVKKAHDELAFLLSESGGAQAAAEKRMNSMPNSPAKQFILSPAKAPEKGEEGKEGEEGGEKQGEEEEEKDEEEEEEDEPANFSPGEEEEISDFEDEPEAAAAAHEAAVSKPQAPVEPGAPPPAGMPSADAVRLEPGPVILDRAMGQLAPVPSRGGSNRGRNRGTALRSAVRGRGGRGGGRRGVRFAAGSTPAKETRPPNVLSQPATKKRKGGKGRVVGSTGFRVGDASRSMTEQTEAMQRKLPTMMRNAAILSEQAGLDIFMLVRDNKKHRNYDQSDGGPFPRYYVFAGGKEVGEEGEKPDLKEFTSVVNSAKNSIIRQKRKTTWVRGEIYTKVYDRTAGEPTATDLKRRAGPAAVAAAAAEQAAEAQEQAVDAAAAATAAAAVAAQAAAAAAQVGAAQAGDLIDEDALPDFD